jgi:hypothetical protein
MRDPNLRDTAGDWWDKERKEGEWGREDEDVQRMAERLGFGYTDQTGIENGGVGSSREGKLKSSAKLAVEALKTGFKPSEAC